MIFAALLLVAGAALVVAGAAVAHPAAGLVVAGLVFLALARAVAADTARSTPAGEQ